MRFYLPLMLAPFLLLTSCKGLANLAESLLYANEGVNKDFPVPEVPPQGVKELSFVFAGEDGSQVDVKAWYVPATSPSSTTVVYLHGNGENIGSLWASNLLNVVAGVGVNILAVDYPDYGRSTGLKNEYNLVTGAVRAIEWVRSHQPQGRLVVWGRSMGASVALMATALKQRVVDGLVLTSPWTSFYELAIDRTKLAKRIPKEWLEKHSYNSVLVAPQIDIPTLIHHGLDDTIVPIKFGRQLAAHFRAGLQFVMTELPGRGHNDIFQDETLWDEVVAFLHQ